MDEPQPYNVFVAVSYSAACRDEQGRTPSYRHLLRFTTESLEKLGLRVYLAPREEEWGAGRPPRSIGIARDIRALHESSLFVFFLNGNDSDGALVELGMALGLGKRIWILHRPSEKLPSYVTGLSPLGVAHMREIDNELDCLQAARTMASDQQIFAVKTCGKTEEVGQEISHFSRLRRGPHATDL